MSHLVLADSPTKAKTIWSAIGDPDNWVVMPVESDIVGFGARQGKSIGVDVKNGYAPVWGVQNEKVFKVIAAKAREAKTVWLATSPDRRGEWLAALLTESLQHAGATAEFKRLYLPDLSKPAIRQAIRAGGTAIEWRHVEHEWRWRIANRIVGFDVAHATKFVLGVEFHLELEDLRLLRAIAVRNAMDVQGIGESSVTEVTDGHNLKTLLCATCGETSPGDALERIESLHHLGYLCGPAEGSASDEAVNRCLQSFVDFALTVEPSSSPQVDEKHGLVLPNDAHRDILTIPPSLRRMYTAAWMGAAATVRGFKSPGKAKIKTAGFASSIGHLIRDDDPVASIQSIVKLQHAGLVRGWQVLALTQLGRIVTAALRWTHWKLGSSKFHAEIRDSLLNGASRNEALGPISTAIEAAHAKAVRTSLKSAEQCPDCSHALVVKIEGNPVLACTADEHGCGKRHTAMVDDYAVKLFMPHVVVGWCSKCGPARMQAIQDANAGPIVECLTCSTKFPDAFPRARPATPQGRSNG